MADIGPYGGSYYYLGRYITSKHSVEIGSSSCLIARRRCIVVGGGSDIDGTDLSLSGSPPEFMEPDNDGGEKRPGH